MQYAVSKSFQGTDLSVDRFDIIYTGALTPRTP
jgi:hypothetical protein